MIRGHFPIQDTQVTSFEQNTQPLVNWVVLVGIGLKLEEATGSFGFLFVMRNPEKKHIPIGKI